MESHSIINFLLLIIFLLFSWLQIRRVLLFWSLLLAVLLLLIFTISGAEVALFSLNKKDMNMLKTKQHLSAKRIVNFLEEPKEVYASLLIAGTFVNICIIVLSNFLINQFISLWTVKVFGEVLELCD